MNHGRPEDDDDEGVVNECDCNGFDDDEAITTSPTGKRSKESAE